MKQKTNSAKFYFNIVSLLEHSKFAESRERHVIMIIYVLFGEIAYLTGAESPYLAKFPSLERGVTRGVTRDII